MHRRQHKPYILIALCVALAVGFLTWRDMRQIAEESLRGLRHMIYADSDADLQTDAEATGLERHPFLVQAGTLARAEDGAVTLVPAVAPVTLPQREVNLIFTAPELPPAFGGMTAAVAEGVAAWKRRNNIISEIMIDWQVADPDLAALPAFANALRSHLNMEYWIGMTLRRRWFGDAPGSALEMARQTRAIKTYIYDLSEAARDGESLAETVAALNALGAPFLLRMENPPKDAKTLHALIEANDAFAGFVHGVPAAPPLPALQAP